MLSKVLWNFTEQLLLSNSSLVLSHLLLPLFCWLCLLHQQPPPQQRFRDKNGMLKKMVPSLDLFLLGLLYHHVPCLCPSFKFSFNWGTLVHGNWLCSLLHYRRMQGLIYFCNPRLHTWKDQRDVFFHLWLQISSVSGTVGDTWFWKSPTKEKSRRAHRRP